MTDHAHSEPRFSSRQQALLFGLADGTLSDRRRARAEALVGRFPDAAREVERQRRVGRALGHGPRPDPAWQPQRPRATPLPRRPRLLVAGALAAAVLAVLVVRLGDDRSTVALAADLSQRPATQPAPAAAGPVLKQSVQGVTFPEWGDEFGWHETGQRQDVLDGRQTKTVFYEHMGHRIAYTIVSGAPLPRPDEARVVRRDGMRIAIYHDPAHGGHDVAVFERGGRTCVLAGHVLDVATLVKLAAWRGDGAVRA